MNEDLIKKIQNRIVQLLPEDQNDNLGILLADSCSEVSRLVAGWIKILDKSNRIFILKGDNVCGTKKSHDILAIMTNSNDVYVVDPTIWQFFPEAKSILVCVLDNFDLVLPEIESVYGGQWVKSEEFIKINKDDESKYLNVIAQNIRENLEQTE